MGLNQKVRGSIYADRTVGGYVQFSFPLSFETNEQGAAIIPVFEKLKVVKLHAVAVKAIAGTDSATITPANETGNMAGGTLTFAASDPIGTEKSATSITTNNILAKDEKLTVTPAKSTAGGVVLVNVTARLL
jgi:hypothetical protein